MHGEEAGEYVNLVDSAPPGFPGLVLWPSGVVRCGCRMGTGGAGFRAGDLWRLGAYNVNCLGGGMYGQ